jgi:formylglycine-generating enzyme required for sulfatase activity
MCIRAEILFTLILTVGSIASEPTVLIPAGSDWKYWDEGNEPTNWQVASFDDSEWKSGPAPLGYSPNKEDGEVTLLDFGGDQTNKRVAYYFRGKFSVVSTQANIRCRMRVDDGAVVYLNGHEVWRYLMPNGNISSLTLATGTVQDEGKWQRRPIPSDLLTQGENWIAVEVHQAGASSSDLRFDFDLECGDSSEQFNEGKGFVISLAKGVAMAFEWIPPGSVSMPMTDPREVGVSFMEIRDSGFWMSRYEVTQAQWLSLMPTNPSHFKGVDRPVENVTWEESAAFCEKLNGIRKKSVTTPADTGSYVVPEFRFKLPTEIEWEFACGGATSDSEKHIYCSGDEESDLEEVGWYMRNAKGGTHPVGQKKPNHFGLYDMHGNVWEWCSNYRIMYFGDGYGPQSLDDIKGEYRAIRGGSWFNTGFGCRTANRGRLPAMCGGSIGFRVCLVAVRKN